MAPRETENNAYAKFGVTNKEHYGMLWYFLEWSISQFVRSDSNVIFASLIFVLLFLLVCMTSYLQCYWNVILCRILPEANPSKETKLRITT